ncbi:MAG: hypothetical protein SVK08_02910 [Halobacteriota archaeon]|nr:hypothetical protein [Halobacteriota archaeon]
MHEEEYQEKMILKGYRYRIDLPDGQGLPLYVKDFTTAKEAAKEYGKGTLVTKIVKE